MSGELAEPASGEIASAALQRYSLDPAARLTFVRHGENTTFRVETGRAAWALRIGRPGYQSEPAVRSELAWMEALAADGIPTPAVVRGLDNDALQTVSLADGTSRTAVAFAWVEGSPLPEVADLAGWGRLGEIMAAVHEHGRRWPRPPSFVRPAWDAEALVGERPRWGDPLPPGAWAREDARLLAAARDAVRERLEAIGTADDRFGLVHADLGFENVLVGPGGRTVVIDFDDSGPSWFLYELASALYPLEDEPGFAERRDALVTGYRSRRELPDEQLGELPTLLMARRLATLGWMFTRAETAHAKRQRERRLRTSPPAAERFLAWHRRSRQPGAASYD